MTFLLPDQWDLTLQASQDNNVTVQKPESGLSCNDPENLTHSQPVMDISMLNIISHVKWAPSLSSPGTRLHLLLSYSWIYFMCLFIVGTEWSLRHGWFPVCPGMHHKGRQKHVLFAFNPILKIYSKVKTICLIHSKHKSKNSQLLSFVHDSQS